VTERARILLFSIGIMAAVSLSTAATAIYVLYEAGFEVHRARLSEVVQSRARMIESIAHIESSHLVESPEEATAATLAHVVDAHAKFEGFGETGEFTLARREGDQIVWLLAHRHPEAGRPESTRHTDVEMPPSIPFASGLAEPMVLALEGGDGIVEGLDYRGVEVLAAYESIRGLGWGVVAKIDIAEVRQPLVRAGRMVSSIALIAIALGVGFIISVTSPLIRSIEVRTEELAYAHERLRSHSAQVSLEVEQARRRLAVDLHDGLGQALALANIKLGMLREKGEVEEIAPRVQEIEDIIGEARTQSKELTWQLSPPVLYELGLVAAVRWLANDMQRRYGLEVTVEDQGECAGLDETTRVSLFRSVNELLINVAKHANIDQASVRLSNRVKDIMIVVEDRGVGFDSSSNASEYGLFSVRERMHHLGGILTIASRPGEGTRVTLVVPRSAAGSETTEDSV
jgi:signal transduction histidine kinase